MILPPCPPSKSLKVSSSGFNTSTSHWGPIITVPPTPSVSWVLVKSKERQVYVIKIPQKSLVAINWQTMAGGFWTSKVHSPCSLGIAAPPTTLSKEQAQHVPCSGGSWQTCYSSPSPPTQSRRAQVKPAFCSHYCSSGNSFDAGLKAITPFKLSLHLFGLSQYSSMLQFSLSAHARCTLPQAAKLTRNTKKIAPPRIGKTMTAK